MITVLQVVQVGGENHWLNGLAEHFDRARFRQLTVSLGPRSALHESLRARNMESFALDAPSRKQLPLAIARLARLIRRERADVVQTHLFDATTVGVAAARLARARHVIVTRHYGALTTVFDKPIHRRIDRWHALAANRVWAPSQYVKDSMMRYEGVPDERIRVLTYGFDFDRMQPRLSTETRRALRNQLGGDDHFLVGAVGRLSEEKCYPDFLRSAKIVARERPRVRFFVVGAGPLENEIKRLTVELGLGDRVLYTGWRDDAWDLIEAADLMVHAGPHEAACIVYVESMAFEKAVVAAGAASAPEILDDGATGRLVPPGSPEAMARAILELVDDPARARKMGVEGRKRAFERYNYPKVVKAYEDYYGESLR